MKIKLLVGSIVLSSLPIFAHSSVINSCGTVGGYDYPYIEDINSQNMLSVSSLAELEAALQSGIENIFIPGDTTIELPYQNNALVIPDNVSLFSDRGRNGSEGAMLKVDYIDEQEYNFPIIQTGSNVHISGLRLQGPVKHIDTDVLTLGIQTQEDSSGLIVENSELYGWGGGAISLKKTQNARIHHNYIHLNQKRERGYGVVVQNGDASTAVYCNVFDSNRHSIAGSGKEGESYTASNNIILQTGEGHSLDMHEDADSSGDGGQAVNVINNWFVFGGTEWGHYPSVKLRGVPRDGLAGITGNIFRSPFEFVDGGDRSKRALEGVPGAMHSDPVLQELNQFNVDMTFRKAEEQCFLDYQDKSVPVLCQAVEKYISTAQTQPR
ncbi:right-handed parallel beta-helix repeat-containing protein [Psychromonas ossibalaenae]|uniref:right-handed parallel beta-helix repeat-containing protein n=1 Tax=Psychromonas ossibalaenae TaxID=444922 RepID=UPI0003650895|nr:right-handed parallel beta-helix repeat-containing protein [Psychromonas ossibalaenae]